MSLRTVLLCVDGSEAAVEAVRAGLALLRPAERLVLVTVVEPADPSLVVGTGLAGGVVSPGEFAEIDDAMAAEGQAAVQAAAQALGLPDAELLVLRGDPGTELCDLAAERPADAIVMGTRGRGGIKRALLGSVSDHVVRHAPCPVVVTRPPD